MKRPSLSLTALLPSLTALLLASCENKAEQGTSPQVSSGRAEAFNSPSHSYETLPDDFTPKQVN